ncbi:MAG: DUF177 domain-containing protein [Ruminococcaceae bacterium]|nr:DUF177 domain-containing protein [Oscillospiraceae bacterium]
MNIDVSRIVSAEGAVVPVSGTVAPENLMFNGQDIRFTAPVTVEGKVENIGGDVYLSLDITATFLTNCARCLKEIERTLSFSVHEVFSKREIAEDEDVLPLESDEIALAPLVEDAFCMELPYNYLCDEDCAGLCPVCGCDRNQTDCGCETEQIDPRLAALKDFLQ